jgi:DNA-binding MarR family transcriptional regulator
VDRAEMTEVLREQSGTPVQLAAVVGVDPQDRTFKRVLKGLAEQGVLVAEGSTHDRRYRNAEYVDTDGELLAVLPCTARDFSDHGRALGLEGPELGKRKLALQIETFKGEDGRWHCRHVPGYRPRVNPRPDSEGFARMAARAGKGGGTIGAVPKPKRTAGDE